MKAWVIHHFGLDGLSLVERPTPQPGPHQVLVRVRAASLNPRDRMVVDGMYAPAESLPVILGSDAAGEVVALGSGTTRLAVGDRVVTAFAQRWIAGPADAATMHTTLGTPRDGVLAEYVVLDEDGAVRIPDELSFEDASTLPVAAVTAWHALFGDASVRAGDTVVVQGTGGVAVFAIQLAHAAGVRVIATSSSDAKLDRARQLGADEVINYRTTPAWDVAVRALTGGRGADLVVDVAGGAELARSVRAVRNGGQVSLIGLVAGPRMELEIVPLLKNNIRLQGIYVGSRAQLAAVVQAASHHRIKPVIDRVYRFDQARDALARLGDGSYVGKLVVAGVA